MEKIKRLCVGGVLLFCFQSSAHAGLTLSEGLKSYQAGDFGQARLVFERLAELGHAGAQFNLAAIYYRGEGVDKDPVKAYGWFYLAGENGDQEAQKLADRIYKKFPPLEQIAAIKFRDSLISGYGKAALNASLIPEITRSDLGYCQIKKIDRQLPHYPALMAKRAQEGWVDVEFTISKEGYVKDIHVVEFSHKGFIDAATQSLRRHKYAPPLVDGRNSEVFANVNRMIFLIGDDASGPYKTSSAYKRRLDQFIADILEKARAGDPYHQYLYGYVMASHPRVDAIDNAEKNEWYLKAAQGGFRQAQYALGFSLLYGQGCVPDHTKAMEWLTLAAQGDHPRAQLLLGRILLRLRENPEHREKGLFWINKAVEQGYPPAVMALAGIQATSSDEKLRNPANALKLASPVYKEYLDQVTALETMAAAYAGTGDFKQAVKFQKLAIKEAKDLEWSLEQMRLQLEAYNAGKAWYES